MHVQLYVHQICPRGVPSQAVRSFILHNEAGVRAMQKATAHPYLFFGAFVGGIAAVTAYLAWSQCSTSVVVSALIGANFAGLVAMGLDKSFSRSSANRIPEVVLYILGLLGGSPGIIAGVYIFKHKTRKAAFQFTLLIVFTLQVALVRALAGW